jgi:hypothetical protein
MRRSDPGSRMRTVLQFERHRVKFGLNGSALTTFFAKRL